MNLDWHETKQRIGVRIEELRAQLEQVGLGMEETNALRGEIRGLRNFVEGVEPGAHVAVPPSVPYV